MRHTAKIGAVGIALVAVMIGCQGQSDDFTEVLDGQHQIMTKLADLEKTLGLGASPPAAAPRPERVYNIPAGDSPFKGPANAPVLLVEFSDFQCSFCAQVPSLVDQVLKVYPTEVKFVYKQFPITTHQYGMSAARAALAAHRQGKFWEMHDKLFENQNALQPDRVKEYARQIGLDVARFEKDLASVEVQRQIDEESKLADQSEVAGTPTLFVNGRRVENRSFESIKSMIQDSLQKKG